MIELIKTHPYLSVLVAMVLVTAGFMYFTGFIISLADAWSRSASWFTAVLLIPFLCCYYCIKYRDKLGFAAILCNAGAIIWIPALLTWFMVFRA